MPAGYRINSVEGFLGLFVSGADSIGGGPLFVLVRLPNMNGSVPFSISIMAVV